MIPQDKHLNFFDTEMKEEPEYKPKYKGPDWVRRIKT